MRQRTQHASRSAGDRPARVERELMGRGVRRVRLHRREDHPGGEASDVPEVGEAVGAVEVVRLERDRAVRRAQRAEVLRMRIADARQGYYRDPAQSYDPLAPTYISGISRWSWIEASTRPTGPHCGKYWATLGPSAPMRP